MNTKTVKAYEISRECALIMFYTHVMILLVYTTAFEDKLILFQSPF